MKTLCEKLKTQRVINTGCSMEAYSRSTQVVTHLYARFQFTLSIHKGFPRFPWLFEGTKAARRHEGHVNVRPLFAASEPTGVNCVAACQF